MRLQALVIIIAFIYFLTRRMFSITFTSKSKSAKNSEAWKQRLGGYDVVPKTLKPRSALLEKYQTEKDFCLACGTKQMEGSVFCMNCGTTL